MGIVVLVLRHVDLDLDPDDLFTCLGKEGTLFALEETTGRSRDYIHRRGGWKESHKLMSCGWYRPHAGSGIPGTTSSTQVKIYSSGWCISNMRE